jgi:microcystin-dependent protein
MPSTYTGSGIELIGDGEQSGSWGNTTNLNLQIINRLVSEAGVIALAGTTHTLTIADGTLSDGQYAVLVFGGAPSGTNTVTISPNDAKRVFIVSNTTNQNVVLTQGSGGNVTVGVNGKVIVYSDGAGASAAVVDITPATPTLAAIGALTPTDGNFIVGNGSTWVAESGNTVLQSIGVTATTTELNLMDGVTATTAELNFTDGVTSNIQTQLDGKQPLDADLTAIGALAKTDGNFIVGNGSTWVAESGNTVLQSIGVTATATELNVLDGITATTAELNTLDGIAPTGAGFGYVPQGGIILWSGSVASIPSGWFLCNGSNGTPDLRNRFVVGAGDSYAVGATGGADSVTLDASQIPGHTHTFSGSTNTTGAHTHTVPNGNSGGGSTVILNGNARSNDANTPTSSAGDHSHTFSGTTASTGGGNSHENRPPYYALAFIQKA